MGVNLRQKVDDLHLFSLSRCRFAVPYLRYTPKLQLNACLEPANRLETENGCIIFTFAFQSTPRLAPEPICHGFVLKNVHTSAALLE